jgi:SSS family solute:Na+ symporter
MTGPAGVGLLGAVGSPDLAITFLAVALLPVISWILGRRETTTEDFFLGSRKIPGWAAGLSLVAAEVSALTIVGVPAAAYSENWRYLQFFIGSAAARIAVAFLFIPVFYRYQCTSIYEYLRHRFGPETQYTGSIFFFITRLVASGVRLYAACMGVSVIMGWTLGRAVLLFTVVSILFIAVGGIKAVVWAGAYQAVVFFAAGAVLLAYLIGRIEGPLAEALQTAAEAGRLSIFDFRLNLNEPTTFWAGTANAFFIGLAVFGTDQEMVQRLLTVETRRKSQHTIYMTIAAGLPVLLLYLAIGTGLYLFYQQHPDLPAPGKAKEVLSYFITHSLPTGLKGLLLSAIILAGIDSPLSSLTSSFVSDIYRPLLRPDASQRHYLIVSRIGVAGFGVILALIALGCAPVENILWFAFEIFSVTGGATLGVFLLGTLTKTCANRENVIAMIASTGAMTALLLLKKFGRIDLAWSWLIVLGTFTTMIISYLLTLIFDARGNIPSQK